MKDGTMQVLAIVSQKGGVGKSTLTRALGVAAVADGRKVVIIDADPQGTVTEWKKRRVAAPTVIGLENQTLHQVVATARQAGANFCIIDTPPHLRATVGLAAEVADAILIPCRPSPEDLWALGKTVEMLDGSKAKIGLVFNAGDARRAGLAASQGAVSVLKVLICPTVIMERADHPSAAGKGLVAIEHKPTSKGAEEMRSVWQWTLDNLLM